MEPTHQLEASFSALALSIGSSAAMAMGLAPNPQTGKPEHDSQMARFNIDLLRMLEEKTKNNLSKEESDFLQRLLTDLQLRFVESEKETLKK